MKPKFYISLLIDSINEDKVVANVKTALQDLLEHFLKSANHKNTSELPFEPVIFCQFEPLEQHPIFNAARDIGFSIEYLNKAPDKKNEQHLDDFLIAKCNLIIVVENAQEAQQNPFTTQVVSKVIEPELFLDNNQYFCDHYEFLPFLYKISITAASFNAQFVRKDETQKFDRLMKNYNEIAGELRKIKTIDETSKLRKKLAASTSNNNKSMLDFYDIGKKFDLLAGKHQGRSNSSFLILFFLTVVLGASFLLYAKVFTHSPWLLILYLFTYTLGVICFYRVKKKASLQKHLAYRLCAETLRLKLFQTLATANDTDNTFQLENAISKSKVNTDWIAHILRGFGLHQIKADLSFNERKDIIQTHLVSEQLQYFNVKLSGKGTQNMDSQPRVSGLKKLLHRFEIFELAIVFVSVAILTVVTLTAYKVGYFSTFYPIKHLLMFLVGFLPLIGLAIEQMVFNFAWQENELRYHLQLSRFKSIQKWLNEAKTPEALSRVTNQLCEECVLENFTWYCTRINRQHKPASGG